MLFRSLSLSFHAAYFAADKSDLSRASVYLYILGMDIASVAMLVVLLAATVAGILKRRRARAMERPSVTPAASTG